MRTRTGVCILLFLVLNVATSVAQDVPYGVNYQAVARNSYGEELANRQIEVRFSIFSGSREGVLEYQELHSGVTTSPYGVFNLVIGTGTPQAGEKELFSDINWELDNHFLKVEIKFSSDFINMGSIQFLSVPYALYAGRSLEPGPEGPEGPPGDPATDDQQLSFDGINLSIDGGNTVNLGVLVNDPNDEIQYLSIAGDSLSITNGNSIKLQEINIDDADADPVNELQTLAFDAVSSRLTITDGNDVDLSTLNNTDNQELSYNDATRVLTISNGSNAINLSELKNDNDSNPANELISSASLEGSELVIVEGTNTHRVDLSSNMVAFRAEKNLSELGLSIGTNYNFVVNNVLYNDAIGYNSTTGEFTAPITGIYTFNIGYLANGSGDGREIHFYLNGSIYETLNNDISAGQKILSSITLKLSQNDVVKVMFNTGLSTESGTGSFSGFRVY